MSEDHPGLWQAAQVTSPHLDRTVAVLVARDIPYIANANRFQTLSIYQPVNAATQALEGTALTALPEAGFRSRLPRFQVHLHGGAWRDPELTAASIEATVAHAFHDPAAPLLSAIASVNYTISQFQTHPSLPYDAIKDNHTDRSREATHPQHVNDAYHAFALLRSLGLSDGSYVLTGHSCGACLAFQTILQPPEHYGLGHLSDAPCPAAILGLNGLYDLHALVYGLGPSHEHLRDDYEMFLTNAFGADKTAWSAASPARFDPARLSERVRAGMAPGLVVLDQSLQDQLVPMNQRARLEANLVDVDGLHIARGRHCTGEHAAPWKQGTMICDEVRDVLIMLDEVC